MAPLDRERDCCNALPMPKALGEVARDALELAPRQRLALVEFLLESTDLSSDPEAESAWEAEIHNRIRAIDEGRVTGFAYEDVMRAAEGRFTPRSPDATGLSKKSVNSCSACCWSDFAV